MAEAGTWRNGRRKPRPPGFASQVPPSRTPPLPLPALRLPPSLAPRSKSLAVLHPSPGQSLRSFDPAGGPGLVQPGRGPRWLRLSGSLALPVILRAAAIPLAYLLLALAGAATGLALSAAVLALAGRTLFGVTPLTAHLILVCAPLLGLLPLSFLLLGAPPRSAPRSAPAPPVRAHLWRLIALWTSFAALLAFAFGVLPFLR